MADFWDVISLGLNVDYKISGKLLLFFFSIEDFDRDHGDSTCPP
jgi:hypothetical protein